MSLAPWKKRRLVGGVVEFTSSDGQWKIDNNLNRPPLVPEEKWKPWSLYRLVKGDWHQVGDEQDAMDNNVITVSAAKRWARRLARGEG